MWHVNGPRVAKKNLIIITISINQCRRNMHNLILALGTPKERKSHAYLIIPSLTSPVLKDATGTQNTIPHTSHSLQTKGFSVKATKARLEAISPIIITRLGLPKECPSTDS